MNWIVNQHDSLHYHIIWAEFSAENNKEEKAAKRMNSFFNDIISAAMKKSVENGQKYYISVSPSKTDSSISILYELRIRDHGKTLKSTKHISCWKNGVIVKKT